MDRKLIVSHEDGIREGGSLLEQKTFICRVNNIDAKLRRNCSIPKDLPRCSKLLAAWKRLVAGTAEMLTVSGDKRSAQFWTGNFAHSVYPRKPHKFDSFRISKMKPCYFKNETACFKYEIVIPGYRTRPRFLGMRRGQNPYRFTNETWNHRASRT
jgi:hypothetical protein